MHKFFCYILVAILLHLPATAFSQYDDTLVNSIEPPPPPEEESVFFSDTISQAVSVKKVPRAKMEELKKDEDYWYANTAPEKKQEVAPSAERDGLLDQKWFRDLLWLFILLSFIAVVIWYLASSNIRLFRKESKRIIDEEVEDEWTDDIHTIQYDKEIEKAVHAGNYRLAVRLWYLRTLKELADRNIIDYRHERTNTAYVNSLFGGRYYKDFFRLTRNFEYTWYGQFRLSAEAYEMMRTDFTNFKNSLPG